MKEYLVRKGDVYYAETNHDEFDEVVCGIPDGADIYAMACDGIATFWNSEFQFDKSGCIVRDVREENYTFDEWQIHWKAEILWQRQESSEVGVKHSHYKKDVSQYEIVDVYRVLELFNVTNPCLQHAIKKLLCAGERGVKDADKDIQEAIDTLNRYKEMKIEDLK